MNYRYAIISTILWLSITIAYTQTISDDRPNIIFLLADDLRDNMFGIMGHPVVKTPHLDQLIEKSVRFSNTYIAEPVCSPSRVSLFTSVYERIHGVGFSSSYQLTADQWMHSYPAILSENGYYTGFVGKFGVEYYTFTGEAPNKFDYWYGHDGWTKFFPKDHQSPSCIPYHGAEADIITPIMSEGITDFLQKRDTTQPFCLSVSLNVPHGSQTTSMYMGFEDWHAMSRPANANPQLKGHPLYDQLYRDRNFKIPTQTTTDPYMHIPKQILDQDKGRNSTYEYSYNQETCREHHIRYFQQITGLDELVGKLLISIEQNGLTDHTIIIFGSDHGLLMGEYGMGGKSLLYDLTAKIPCFIYDPRIPDAEKGKTLDELVSSLDIPVTILDYAGIEAPAEMQGKSLVPLIEGKATEWREELFLESLFTLRDNPFCEGIRKGKWKYIRMYDGVTPYTEEDIQFSNRQPDFEQLFDLEADPGEQTNLIAQYEGSRVLEELREKVADYSTELNIIRNSYCQTHVCEKR